VNNNFKLQNDSLTHAVKSLLQQLLQPW